VIPQAAIVAWGQTRPWPTPEQVEQDLLLARLIVAIYEHPLLREELVFRGGTCLHQVHLPDPLRYSEDLDFVRLTHTGIGPLFDAVRAIADEVGLTVKSRATTEHPKIKLRALAEGSGLPLSIKIEINTHETSRAADLIRHPFSVNTSWFSGSCLINTFSPAELVSTKLRALYERRKGRDLFDLWLALQQMHVPPEHILECFESYRPSGYTSKSAIENLQEKMADLSFRNDLKQLVSNWPVGYAVDTAGELVIEQLLSKIRPRPT
jgi:predicted nucleotidyltransferase component of viral defense system